MLSSIHDLCASLVPKPNLFRLSIVQTPCISVFFFFQAEDGIRDLIVTGVQTCALPILPHDTAQAARLLTRLGWRDSNGDGIRDRDGQPLAFRILVPTTSQLRRQYARLLQEQFRRIGADAQLDEVEFSVFDQRTQAGRFDAAVIARTTDPPPSSSIGPGWTAAGHSHAGRYANPLFDRLGADATAAPRRDA